MPPLNVDAVALRLGISNGRVRQLINEGQIPAFRPGGRRLMVESADLERFIESRKVSPAATQEVR